MGVSCMSSCSCGSYSSSATPDTPPLAPNPNPFRFDITLIDRYGDYAIVVAKYKDCTNYEGKKIMVFKDFPDNINKLDPHFSEDAVSPIARFRPDRNGIKNAKAFVSILLEDKL